MKKHLLAMAGLACLAVVGLAGCQKRHLAPLDRFQKPTESIDVTTAADNNTSREKP